MQVTLTPDLERQVAEAVAAGRFADPAEAVAEGLRLLFAMSDAASDIPRWLRIGETDGDTVPEAVVAALDRGAEDLRLGRTEDASAFLTRMDAKIAAYFSHRGGKAV